MAEFLFVLNPDPVHLGNYLLRGARRLGLEHEFADSDRAYRAHAIWLKLCWRFGGHRPPRLRAFSREVVEACRRAKPRILLTAGMAPVEAWALEAAGRMGARRVNYLTDDPWNPVLRGEWFLRALPHYDTVFSTRTSNAGDLEKAGCRDVRYLPFAYEPELHYPEAPGPDEAERYKSDVVFVGGADEDRIPYARALSEAGLEVHLYGSYWERCGLPERHVKGRADARVLRLAVGGAKVSLCLVRRANRDGNSMRTFEIPAIGSCMLAEDTAEHRRLFGEEGNAVLYFRSPVESVAKARRLIGDEGLRARLAASARAIVTGGAHTYQDRLLQMLGKGPSDDLS